jgi:hypothetical protein
MRPRNPQLLFIRTAEYIGVTQIDISIIEISPRYNRPPWKPVNEKQFEVRLSAFGPETSIERYRMETTRTLDKDYGKHVNTGGSNLGEKFWYAIVKEEHTIKNRILPQNTVFNTEQSAIIGAIQSEKNTQNSNNNGLPKHDNGSWKSHTNEEPKDTNC